MSEKKPEEDSDGFLVFSADDMSLIDANDKTLKKRRNYVKSACIPCRKAHTACDETKPCSRCISRGIPHLCVHEDEEEISKQVPEEKGALRFEIHDSFAENQRNKPKKIH